MREPLAACLLLFAAALADVTDLRTEYLETPYIDSLRPRFFFKTDQPQTAYRIVVSSDPELRQIDIWDSGRVVSNSTIQIECSGKALASDTRYFWRATTWWSNSSFEHSDASWFHTGLLARSDWQGQFIGGFTMLRKRFSLDDQPVLASVFVTGVGAVSLRVNRWRSPNVLEPGFSTIYTSRLLYASHDVTDALRAGDNEIVLLLGAGKFGYLGEFCKGDASVCRAAILQLNIRLKSGKTVSAFSDGSWQGAAGPIVRDHVYHGETFDSRQEQPRVWQPVKLMTALQQQLGQLTVRSMPPMRVNEEIKPIAMKETSAGHWLFDMGKNIAGFARLNLPAGAQVGRNGSRIVMLHGEILHRATGAVFNAFSTDRGCLVWEGDEGGNCANQTNTFIMDGRSEAVVYQPVFTYAGFRYVQLTGYPGTPTLNTVTGCFVHSAVERTGKFSAGSEVDSSKPLDILDEIQAGIVTTQLANLQSVPTDCPHREKRGWMGDAQWTAEEAALNFDMAAFYSNFVRSMRDTQVVGCTPGTPSSHLSFFDDQARPPQYTCCDKRRTFGCANAPLDNVNSSLPDVVPWDKFPYGGFPGDPTWQAAAFEIPRVVWRQYGDTRLLRESYDMMRDLMAFFQRHTVDGLVGFGDYGDWLAIDKTLVPFVSAFSVIRSLDALAQIADALNKTSDAAGYRADAATARTRFHARYWNTQTSTYATDSQTANALALILGVVPAELRAKVIANLVASVARGGGKPTVGAVGSRWLLQALSDAGRADLALQVASNVDQPSWGYFIRQGPGTMWEEWGGDFYTAGSKSHPMFGGGIGSWMYTHLAGLRVLSPQHVEFALDAVLLLGEDIRLPSAQAELKLLSGRVAVQWKRSVLDEQRIAPVRITLPANVVADVFLTNVDALKLPRADCEPQLVLNSNNLRSRATFEQLSSNRYRVPAGVEREIEFVAFLCGASMPVAADSS